MNGPLPVQLVVLAKRPVPGRVKTRLTPPYSPVQAATLAAAALADTLDAVAAAPVAARVLAFDQWPGHWLRPGFALVRQRGAGLAERLGAVCADAFRRHRLPVLLVGMDTPQLTATFLVAAARRLVTGRSDAVLGPASDGGYWAIGLRAPRPEAFAGVPMSTATTCADQLRRCTQLGLRVDRLGELTDVDDAVSARAVAAVAPATRFAARLGELDRAREAA